MTNVIGTTGTTGLSGVTFILRNRAGQVWNGSAFVTYVQANIASYKISATEQVPTGDYIGSVPSGAQADWVQATFLDSSNGPLATYDNPTITDATIASGSMLYVTAAQFGGNTPTRDATTGTETYKDRNGTTVKTETPSSTAATRVFP
jgi:hypothetical protein